MKKLLALVLAIMMVFGLCACGKNDKAADGNATGDKNKPTVVVGYTLYAPMNYKDDNGVLVGFDTELAKAVFDKMGYNVVFQEINWDNKYTDVDSGTIDCIWNGFTCNCADNDGVQRSDKVDFSYNYMENQQVVVVKKDSGITSAADLSGKLGAAESGSAGESYATETFAGATISGFTKQTDCLMEVNALTADFAVLDVQLARSYVGKGDYADLMILEGVSSDVEYYAIGFKKGSNLTEQVNAALEALAADGTIAALAEKYGVANSAITDFSSQK